MGRKLTCFAVFISLFFGLSFCASPSVLAHTASLSTSGTVTIDVAASGSGANVGTDNVVITSTCPLGYTLTIGGPSDSTLYKDGDSTSADSITASTGTPASPKPILGDDGNGNSYVKTWGYTTASGTTFNSNFIGLTSSATTLTTKNSASASGGDSLPVYYGVSVDKTVEPGSYYMASSGAVTYYLTPNSNCSYFEVQYDGNDDDGDTTMSIAHTNVEEDDELDLYASNFIREGYGFAGWSTEQLDPDDSNFSTDFAAAVSAGSVYGPNERITADSAFLSNAVISGNQQIVYLYAVWVKPAAGATLQGWNGCSSLNIGDVIALTDTRDNDVYAVAKLADNNCWMIENFRLDAADSTDESKAQGFGGVFHGLATSEPAANFSSAGVANSLYSTDGSTTYTVDPATHTYQDTDLSADFIPRYNNTNTASTVADMTDATQNAYSYGNYYSWAAAVANTTFRNGAAGTSHYANTSICPTGWFLPKGSTPSNNVEKNDFLILSKAITGKNPDGSNQYYTQLADVLKFNKYPNNFVKSGSTNTRGSIANLWSDYASRSTSDNRIPNMSFFQININTPRVITATGGSRPYGGVSIRCMTKINVTVFYDANGGTGTAPADQTVIRGNNITLADNTFTKADSYFKGWGTSPGGPVVYRPGQVITTDYDLILYAIWGDSTTTSLYNVVASLAKGTQTNDTNANTGIKAAISKGNSGVYAYNSTLFDPDSDSNNASGTKDTIYYYRGILDTNLDGTSSTYGSNGNSMNYPNYVKLGDTCWRIIRTTGSGGVKMIYNGKFSTGTNANSCANSTTNTQVTAAGFNAASGSYGNGYASLGYRNIHAAGYTYNSAVNEVATATTVAEIFGSDNNYNVNSSDSMMKQNIEQLWFNSADGISNFEGILESSAGYCNDRTLNTSTSWTTPLTDSDTIIPYGTTGMTTYIFGGYIRNKTSGKTPSLNCPRSSVDLYSSSSTNGNNQLDHPVALITADEASFAGSGSTTASHGSPANANSFLRSGSDFWTMTPYSRYSSGQLRGFMVNGDNGQINYADIYITKSVRPVISLASGVTPVSGSGTATEPWTIGTYTINFNANTGSGTMNSQTAYTNFATKLAPNTFTPPTGKGFIGWNTAANGSGTSYAPGEAVTDLAATGSSITLYAQWADSLYTRIASMSKGTQTRANLRAPITVPTSSDPSLDTSNSGVYVYDSTTFGTSSDAANTHTIYYYRGVLDSNLDGTTSTYGSNGDGIYYPNYVRLGDICWRIIRTTGSGGIKMIYNGLYSSGTTANSCANAQTDARIVAIPYGLQGSSDSADAWNKNLNRVGYTFNNSASIKDDGVNEISIGDILGDNTNYSTTNTTNSNAKANIESWFTNNLSNYENILEPSAGYCNDRSIFSDAAGTTAVTTGIAYGQAGYFGPNTRVLRNSTNAKLTLTCPRGEVDLYTTSSASDGNHQLSKPIALLTLDEAALAGSGYVGTYNNTTNYTSNYNYNSYLRSGGTFMTMSPSRISSGTTQISSIRNTNGYSQASQVDTNLALRPSISLISDTAPISGSGTAVDPWVISAP